MRKTISPKKLTKHLEALTKRHAEADAELNALLADPASTINSANEIKALKNKKCSLKNEITRTEAQLAATRPAAPAAPAEEPAAPAAAATDDVPEFYFVGPHLVIYPQHAAA